MEASEEILVNADLDRCFSFFKDLTNIGSCIPGCERVDAIDSTSANFKVKLKVGYISKTFELKAKLKNVKEREELSFTAEGSDAEIAGHVTLSSGEPGVVRVKYTIEIRAISVIGRTAVSMIGKDLVKKQAGEFASCVKQKLEGSV